jgi:dTDP-4-amino-4,6-dideoxygalactose transaminase
LLSAGWDVELVDTDKNGVIDVENSLKGYTCVMGYGGRKPWPIAGYASANAVIVDGAQHWLVCDGDVGSGMSISFDPTKNLPSSGNGGAIVTNDEQLYLFAATHRDKMSEQDCAQILVRAKYIDEWQVRRGKIAKYWCDKFKELPLRCLSDTVDPHAHQKFVMYLDDRNRLQSYLKEHGIDSKVHYEYVLGDLPTGHSLIKPDLLSTSVMLSRGVLSLPMYPELTDAEVDYVVNKVYEFYK